MAGKEGANEEVMSIFLMSVKPADRLELFAIHVITYVILNKHNKDGGFLGRE